MSGTWDKVVKGATKPKALPPKAKYIDPLVSATFQQDGTLQDICRSLQVRLRDPNSVVVFKSLIVVHTLVRSGHQENVLGFLSGSKVLGLESVVSGHDTAQNLNKYAVYLDRRIRTYGAIKYDVIRDKAERRGERDGIRGCNRLRFLSVDKGLLREVTLLQKEMDTLAECKFYLDDMDDDVTMTALRLLVKDLLLIFQAVNEGVINVLEHYFEMSHPDATTALKIYKRFCAQTEKVVAYLSVAKKMQNVINVPIPNLKHAPVSLASSLEEYLRDPNFEKNREEYKENKRIADGGTPAPKAEAKPEAKAAVASTTNGKASTPPPKVAENKDFLDFFSSIEQEQQSMFNPQTGSPTANYFRQQASYNPFLQQQQTMGMPFGGGGMLQTQPTGFAMGGLQPQMTGFAPGGLQHNPFLAQPQQPMFTGHNPFLQPQHTAFPPQQQQQASFGQMSTSFSQPNLGSSAQLQQQPTGFNPFRQSMLSSMTGMPSSGGMMQPPSFGSTPLPQQPFPGANPFPAASAASPFSSSLSAAPRPASVPVPASNGPSSSFGGAFEPSRAMSASPAPLAAQPTGSRNPFAPLPGSQPKPPPVPAGPSMNQLAYNAFSEAQQRQQQNASPFQPGGVGGSTSAAPPQRQGSVPPIGGLMGSVASSFALGQSSNANGGTTSPAPFSNASATSAPAPFVPTSSFGASLNGGTTSPAPLQSQSTGYGGSLVRPFKPTSSFGASLAESLPPIPEPSPAGSTPGGGGGGGPNGMPNPFRASTLPHQATGISSLSSQPTGFSTPFGVPSSFGGSSTGSPAMFGQSAAKPPFSGASMFPGQQQQANVPPTGSLI